MTPATPSILARTHVTAQVASTPKVSPQISQSEADLPKIAQHMFSLMRRNVASDGFLFEDPNDPQSFSLPGCIIVAPSYPANTAGIDQDYVYNWTRDAAIAAMGKLLPPTCRQLQVPAFSR
jgi:glucoamylase